MAATNEVPDKILIDQLCHLIEQVGIIGRREPFDHVSKYNVSMLVCKAAALGNDILLLPLEQRVNMLKYLGMIKKNHGNCLDMSLHRKISSVMVTTALLSVKPTDNLVAASSSDARGSNEATGSDLFASKTLKGTVTTESKSNLQMTAASKLKESTEPISNAMRSKNKKSQKADNENHNGEVAKSEMQPADAVTAANIVTSGEEPKANTATTAAELIGSSGPSSSADANGKFKNELKLLLLPNSSADDLFHVSKAECIFAAESFGERFIKREMVIPKSLSASIFGCGDDVVAMVEILTNTIISFEPSAEDALWQRVAIAGRNKRDVDNTICFMHFLLKYQIKMDFAQLASLCCKFREADKGKEKQSACRKGSLDKNGKSLPNKNQSKKTSDASKSKLLSSSISSSAGRPETGQDEPKHQLNLIKSQLEIPNKAVGKIMGNKGCIVAIIENLTKAVVSFQRTVTDKEKRTLYLKAQRQQDLNCVKELIMLTLEHGIRFGLLTDVLYWGKDRVQSRSFQDLADNMSALPSWESRKGKCYQDVWMPEGRRSIRQLLLKNDRHLKGPFEKSIKLHLPSTTSMRRVYAASDPTGTQRKELTLSGSTKMKNGETEADENKKAEKLAEQAQQECHPNLICNHDNLTPALQRANFLMAAMDSSSSTAIEGNCQLLCEILQLNKATH
ncbi:KH 1 domain containing protein [Trichuris trichiura]|uniref:KH 1 domain containing protein n=1 Tax=Trichuris trichiura TaxID=36087 RepID=A0A077ZB68_TRITR|nr:KH 1 domain containing protein [Trichuris trichiura]